MSQPKISASWETIGKLKLIAEYHDCFRDDDETTPCIGAMLSEIADGNLFVISRDDYKKLLPIRNRKEPQPSTQHVNRTH